MASGAGTRSRTPASCRGSRGRRSSTPCWSRSGGACCGSGTSRCCAATFCLTILGTFLTRSGVIESVHAFSNGAIGAYLLTFFALAAGTSIALIGWRGDRLRSPGSIDSPLSREGAFLANNLLFSLFAFVVLLGHRLPARRRGAAGPPPVRRAPLLRPHDHPARPRAPDADGHRARAAVAQGVGRAPAPRGSSGRPASAWPASSCRCCSARTASRRCWPSGSVASPPGRRCASWSWPPAGRAGAGLLGRANGGMIVHLGVIVDRRRAAPRRPATSGSASSGWPGRDGARSGATRFTLVDQVVEDTPGRAWSRRPASASTTAPVYAPARQLYKARGDIIATPSVRTGLTGDIYLTLLKPATADDDRVDLRRAADAAQPVAVDRRRPDGRRAPCSPRSRAAAAAARPTRSRHPSASSTTGSAAGRRRRRPGRRAAGLRERRCLTCSKDGAAARRPPTERAGGDRDRRRRLARVVAVAVARGARPVRRRGGRGQGRASRRPPRRRCSASRRRSSRRRPSTASPSTWRRGAAAGSCSTSSRPGAGRASRSTRTWCASPPGRPRSPDGAELYSVIFNDDPAEVERFFAEQGGDWPKLTDPDGADPGGVRGGQVARDVDHRSGRRGAGPGDQRGDGRGPDDAARPAAVRRRAGGMTALSARLAVAWLVLGLVAVVALAVGVRRGPVGRARRRSGIDAIARTVKCPVCPGESVYESRNSVALNVKAEIARQVRAGQTDDQIRAGLAARYGESVLLVPRAERHRRARLGAARGRAGRRPSPGWCWPSGAGAGTRRRPAGEHRRREQAPARPARVTGACEPADGRRRPDRVSAADGRPRPAGRAGGRAALPAHARSPTSSASTRPATSTTTTTGR